MARNIRLDDQRVGILQQFYQASGQRGHILRAHMDAAHQVKVLPAGKRDIHTGPGITAGEEGAKRCFYTIKQTHTRSINGKVHASA